MTASQWGEAINGQGLEAVTRPTMTCLDGRSSSDAFKNRV
jgi:hypothetical protein